MNKDTFRTIFTWFTVGFNIVSIFLIQKTKEPDYDFHNIPTSQIYCVNLGCNIFLMLLYERIVWLEKNAKTFMNLIFALFLITFIVNFATGVYVINSLIVEENDKYYEFVTYSIIVQYFVNTTYTKHDAKTRFIEPDNDVYTRV
jgi:hypothetical protein